MLRLRRRALPREQRGARGRRRATTQVRERLVARGARSIKVGDGARARRHDGPGDHRGSTASKVLGYIEKGIERGRQARCSTAAATRTRSTRTATSSARRIFDDVKPEMMIAPRGDLRPGAVPDAGQGLRRGGRDRERARAGQRHQHLHHAAASAAREYRYRVERQHARRQHRRRGARWRSSRSAAPRAASSATSRRTAATRSTSTPTRRSSSRAGGRRDARWRTVMPRTSIGGLIQCSNPINDESRAGREDQAGDVRQAPAAHRGGGQEGRADPLPAGDLQRPVLLPEPGRALVRRGRAVPGPTTDAIAKLAREVPDGDGGAGLRARACRASTTTPPRCTTPTAATSASTARTTSRTPRASGRSTSSSPATSATRCSRRATPRSASTSATTATSPRARALLGLNGAEIVFNPSATVAGLSQYLWKLEQPAHAVANGYFMGCINRVGTEAPWNIGKFYGSSYFVRPARQLPRARPARTTTSWWSPRWTST